MAIKFEQLGKNAQNQVLQKLNKPKVKKELHIKQQFESKLEENYYNEFIYPLILTKQIVNVETHKTFDLLPAAEYCNIKLHKAQYTPDFVLTYANGTVEVVEVKNKKIRKLQQSYVYRRRLFIDKYARPNGWIFKEYITD